MAQLRQKLANTGRAITKLWRDLFALQKREKSNLLTEIMHIRGLLRLLMKQRNGYVWTDEDKQQIRKQLRSLVKISPYVVLFLMPGGLFLLPILAWWLDRRRRMRLAEAERLADKL